MIRLFLLCAAFIVGGATTAQAKPNVLLIIADDMGLDSSPCYSLGDGQVKMPTLEALCRSGIVFDHAYATPMCSSTRATIASGRYGFDTGIGSALGWNQRGGLDTSTTTIFDLTTQAGYANAVIGKWHIGTSSNGGLNHPAQVGVQHYVGMIEGNVDDYSNWTRTENGRQSQDRRYLTTALTDEAISFIGRQGSQPWFLWLAHAAPHGPFHLPPANLHSQNLSGSRQDIRQNPRPYYLAMLEALDSEIARLLDSMDSATRNNTVVMFLGDNGSPRRVVGTPYSRRTAKATLHEGGTHVPLIVAAPDSSRRGVRENALVNSTDLYATIADLTGANRPANSHSKSFADLIYGAGASNGRDYAYTEHFARSGGQGQNNRRQFGWAITDGDYKLLVVDGAAEALYQVSRDEGERRNLIAQQPAIANQLRAAGQAIRAD